MSINHASDKVTYVQILNLQDPGKSSEEPVKALAEDNYSKYSQDSIDNKDCVDSKTESGIRKTMKKYKEVICGNKVPDNMTNSYQEHIKTSVAQYAT